MFAAGDVANAHHPFYGEPVRVEHWANALHQGPVAARAMLGGDDVYDRLPYFFSDQYDVGMEYAGLARSWDRVVFRGDPAGREFIAFWLVGDRVVADAAIWVADMDGGLGRLRAFDLDGGPLPPPEVPPISAVSAYWARLATLAEHRIAWRCESFTEPSAWWMVTDGEPARRTALTTTTPVNLSGYEVTRG